MWVEARSINNAVCMIVLGCIGILWEPGGDGLCSFVCISIFLCRFVQVIRSVWWDVCRFMNGIIFVCRFVLGVIGV